MPAPEGFKFKDKNPVYCEYSEVELRYFDHFDGEEPATRMEFGSVKGSIVEKIENDENWKIYRVNTELGSTHKSDLDQFPDLNSIRAIFSIPSAVHIELIHDQIGIIGLDKPRTSTRPKGPGEMTREEVKLYAKKGPVLFHEGEEWEEHDPFETVSIIIFARPTDESWEFMRSIYEEHLEEPSDPKAKVHMVGKTNAGGLNLKKYDLDYNEEPDLETQYEPFDGLSAKDLQDEMMGEFQKEENCFYILHGDPGTGKTTFIRDTLSRALGDIPHKKIIYMPPHMVTALADPGFIDFISQHKGSLLVIEDAEQVVKDKGERDPAISNLLNLTDGIMGNLLGLDVVCTFNAKIDDIDDALKRKGRLNRMFKFQNLSKERANRVADQFGVPYVEGDTALSNVLNPSTDSREIEGERPSIGY